MDVVTAFVIFVLLCVLLLVNIWYTKDPHTLKKKRPKSAEQHVTTSTPGQRTCSSGKSGYMSNPSHVDNLMNGSDELEKDIGETEIELSETNRTGWTEKDVGGAMRSRGDAVTDFGEAMKRRGRAKTDFGEVMERGNCVEEGGYVVEEKEQVTVSKVTDKYAEFRSFVQIDKLREEMKKEGSLHGLSKYIKGSLNDWKVINIAITGKSGAGKSSLINALRKLKPSDDGAAEVGVDETTTKVEKYTYPENEFVALCDLPGIGTQTFTRDEYLNKMDFSRFDIVIIVTSSRFLETDIWLAEQLSALGKHIIYVRTKIDIDVMNSKRDHPKSFEKEKCTLKMRDNMTENVRKGGLTQTEVEIYLVSSAETDSYDFKALTEKLNGLLNMRDKAIPALLKEHVQLVIKRKQSFNKNEFTGRKVWSVIYGFLPLPNLETGLGNLNISSIHKRCLEKFCLDTKSLERIATELDEQKESLKENLKSYRMIKGSTGKTLLESTEEEKYPETVEKYSKYIVPIIGSFYSAHKNFCTLEKCLEKICDVAAEDELELVTKILDKLERDLRCEI